MSELALVGKLCMPVQILPSVDDGARLEIMNKPSIRKLVGRRIIIKIKKSGGYYGVNI